MNNDSGARQATPTGKKKKRYFKRIASGSVGVPKSTKGKMAVVDLRSPSRSISPSVIFEFDAFNHDFEDGPGPSTGKSFKLNDIMDRRSHLFTPEPTPTPTSPQHTTKTTELILNEPDGSRTPPQIRSDLLTEPATPISTRTRVGPVWSVSSDTSFVPQLVGVHQDVNDEEPISQVFARMLMEQDELDDGNEADLEDMEAESEFDNDAESSVVSSDSGIDDLDPPSTLTGDIVLAPTIRIDRSPSPPTTSPQLARLPVPEVIEILSDTDDEGAVDEWDLFDVENQIFGYRVSGGLTATTTPSTGVRSISDSPESPFKLSPKRLRPEEMDGFRREQRGK